MTIYKNIVVLTGAGISAESGIKTFRGDDGLWEGHRIEDVATPQAFALNPKLVHEFYNLRRRQLKEVTPNVAHEALANFEKDFDGNFLIVTQNVDDLHERAGSQNLIHMHGELLKARHIETYEVIKCEEDLSVESKYRPHIVWFGEMPFQMNEIEKALRECDLFISIGTSGQVYPAAGFVQMVPSNCRKVEFNIDQTSISNLFDEHIIGSAVTSVEKFLKSL